MKTSIYWTSQTAAQAIVAEQGCKLCTWKFPGEIFDVAGDLWCEHCVREQAAKIADLDPAYIP
jgi:hypothetical protein